MFYTGWDLLGARGLKPEHRLDSKTLFDLVKLSFGVVAGAGALVALVVAYRRQRVDEDGALREATRLHTERFTAAVSQIGADSAAVRLGGVHALAGLADDAPTRNLRQTCIDVLCAYLRLPYTAQDDLPAGDREAQHAYLALREVRHTVIRVIRDHFSLAPDHPHCWQGHRLDLRNVIFDGGDLTGAVFLNTVVDFSGAMFNGGKMRFNEAVFSGKVDFSRAAFAAGAVDFRDTLFLGGEVFFTHAKFRGSVIDFRNAVFSGSTVDFTRAAFDEGEVYFNDAQFDRGAVNFHVARFTGSEVDLSGAAFSGSRVDFSFCQFATGTVAFVGNQFSGGNVAFNRARFQGGSVDYSSAVFSGSTVSFERGRFSDGTVDFAGARFDSGSVDFGMARFSGAAIDFDSAQFSGAAVSFDTVSGEAPPGLVPASGSPLPAGLTLPPHW
ncbi:pentapeptide repeat-containing protein [Streptomyces sioyaensis]|uniref:pentapeptide repeat-containing protein n=1 Tax=Streptomyces sioyaensis TaxID=67364 RepID=UPI0033EF5D02